MGKRPAVNDLLRERFGSFQQVRDEAFAEKPAEPKLWWNTAGPTAQLAIAQEDSKWVKTRRRRSIVVTSNCPDVNCDGELVLILESGGTGRDRHGELSECNVCHEIQED